MRIIITKEGVKEFVPLLGESKSTKNLNRRVMFNGLNRSSSVDYHKNKLPSIIKKTSSMENLKNDKDNNNFYKKIKIYPKRLAIPQEQTMLYDKDHSIQSSIVKQTSDIIMSIPSNKEQYSTIMNNDYKYNNQNTIGMLLDGNDSCNSINHNNLINSDNDSEHNSLSLPKCNLQRSYSLKYLINEKCFNNLTNKIHAEQYLNSHDKRLDETILRKENKDHEIFEQIENDKQTEIDINHNSLMEYLINKKSITASVLKLLSSYNTKEDKMYKLNKTCKKLLLNKDIEKNLQQTIQSKVIESKIKEMQNFKKSLNSINSSLNISHHKLANLSMNKLSQKKDIIYKDIHKDFKRKYWKEKNNFQNLYFNKNSNFNYKKYSHLFNSNNTNENN